MYILHILIVYINIFTICGRKLDTSFISLYKIYLLEAKISELRSRMEAMLVLSLEEANALSSGLTFFLSSAVLIYKKGE